MEVEFGTEPTQEGGRRNKRTFRERDDESTSKGADEQHPQSLKRTVKDETIHSGMMTAAEIKAETTPGW